MLVHTHKQNMNICLSVMILFRNTQGCYSISSLFQDELKYSYFKLSYNPKLIPNVDNKLQADARPFEN